MSTPYNKNASALLKTGFGKLKGVFVSTASGSPTLQFVDGITDNDDVLDKAVSTLTVGGAIVPAAHATSEIVSGGACAPADYANTIFTSDGTNFSDDIAAQSELTVSGVIVPGAHATSVITSDTTEVTDGDTITIGSAGNERIYRFKDTMAQAYDVKRDGTAANTLANLKKAINATGTEGVEYFAGTLVHPTVIAGAIDATTITLWARVIGTAANTEATTTTAAHLSFPDTTLGGGTGTSNPGIAVSAAQVVIDATTYTFVNELTETSGQSAVVNQVLWGGTTAIALDNLKTTINGTGQGTTCSTGTVAHTTVNATTNTDTVQTIVADVAGAAANTIVTTTNLTNGAWTGVDLANGTVAGVDAETVTIASTVYRFKDTTTQAYDVKIAGSAALTLDNLKLAINATGVGDGTDYHTGTLVHPTVIATTNTDTQQTLFARVIGTVANTYATTETCAHASFPDTTLGGGTGDSNPGVTAAAATITLGSTVYTAVVRLQESITGLSAVPYQVLWETSEAVFLDNLKLAINATGGSEGTKYGTGTVVHPTVLATTNTNTVQTIIAKVIGTAANSMATSTTLANYTVADTTLGGGTGNSNPGVASTAATVTINSRVYTFVNELTETSGASAVVDQVLWGGDTATALDNFKLAINAGATAGTNYSTGTVVNADVTAETNTDTTQVIQAIVGGVIGNAITTAESLTNGAWGTNTAHLTGGLEVNLMMIEAFVGTAGTMYTFPDPSFNVGLYYRQSGTAEVTIFVD